MCGIAGFTLPGGLSAQERAGRYAAPLRRMTAALRHRGPDAQRALLLDGVALGHTRLSIVDFAGGGQPMRDPGSGVTLVFNGELFNHRELRAELAGSYPFATRSDTEVLLASYLVGGIDAVRTFNGQFAFALWDPRDRALFLVRDRVGICPLFYAQGPDGLAFASEAKALFAGGLIRPELDPVALKQTLQLWSPVEGRSAFVGVRSLPPRTMACFSGGRLRLARYWDLPLDGAPPGPEREVGQLQDELEATLRDSVRLRLRADVPVAAYLSGGLDSSLLCALATEELGGGLRTFSVTFAAAGFDERAPQEAMAARLGTSHKPLELPESGIAATLPEVIFHAEQLLLRAAPAPLLALSRSVRADETKVVLTGEGSDEIFWGYDLFKETQVRQFWARAPRSQLRPRLLSRLYGWLPGGAPPEALLRGFFGAGLERPSDPAFSHRVRWGAGARLLRFLSPELAATLAGEDPEASVVATLPPGLAGARPLLRAQYLEMQTFLAGYLLSAQGDRMLLASGVEGRFPFLDHRLIELAARLPERWKLCGLREKHLLRRLAARLLPAEIAGRPKFPYRAPIAAGLVGPTAPAWARELLSARALSAAGLFDAAKVQLLLAKLAAPPGSSGGARPTSEADSSALMAIASAQLLSRLFTSATRVATSDADRVEVATA